LTVTADDYRIFDQEGNPISLETMHEWCKGWWDGIQLMWDKNKEESHKKALQEKRVVSTMKIKEWWCKILTYLKS
jgi:hypothetical protein